MAEKIAVHVPRGHDAEIVQYNEFRRGKGWELGTKEINYRMMESYKAEACIRITGGMAYAGKSFYQDDGFEIISVTEYLKRFGPKKDKYVIKIKDRDNFDFDRVVREVREDYPEAAGFILTTKNGVAAVVLYNDFLKQFIRGMSTVAYETLSSDWGCAGSISLGATGSLCRAPGTGGQVRTTFFGRKGVPATIKEIQAAKEMVKNPAIKISVRIL